MAYLGARKCQRMGLLDLLLAVIIASLLAAVAIPAYDQFAERARVARAVADLDTIAVEIDRFRVQNNNRFPNSLDELSTNIPVDPWGRAYQYRKVDISRPGFGSYRRDGRLTTLNSDFDLYSMGSDGTSRKPLSATASRDDIVRANNGAYIGLAEDN